MTECNHTECKNCCANSGAVRDEGLLSCEEECQCEPLVPAGYTADELERDNPFNQWMYEGAWK